MATTPLPGADRRLLAKQELALVERRTGTVEVPALVVGSGTGSILGNVIEAGVDTGRKSRECLPSGSSGAAKSE